MPVAPLAFLIPIVVVLVPLAEGEPLRAFLGVAVVLLGVSAYHVVNHGAASDDGSQ